MTNSKFQFSKELIFDPKNETARIVEFIRETMRKTGFKRVVVGVSGGVDSAVVLALCVRALGVENVMAVRMPCGDKSREDRENLEELFEILKLSRDNIKEFNINPIVDLFRGQMTEDRRQIAEINGKQMTEKELIRVGNVMARIRMMVLFDLAKQHNVLVCGTENKSEYLLGYYTRFGDEASDLELIRHLYKTQVYQLARYLGVPVGIINKKPTAGLWERQTDEGELGFTYEEADEILYHVFEEKTSWTKLIVNSEKLKASTEIINKIKKRVKWNWFKKETPYTISNKLARQKQQVERNKTELRIKN